MCALSNRVTNLEVRVAGTNLTVPAYDLCWAALVATATINKSQDTSAASSALVPTCRTIQGAIAVLQLQFRFYDTYEPFTSGKMLLLWFPSFLVQQRICESAQQRQTLR